MRHAHAELPDPGMRDFDRPLSSAGWEDARATAKQFATIGLEISLVFCSPARRTLETLDGIRQSVKISQNSIAHLPELYSGETNAYLDVLKHLGPNDIGLIIGHNPMIEHFAFEIAQAKNNTDLQRLRPGYPTAAMAVIELDASFNPSNPNGRLLHFLTPD
jgi:phosphohistidine phosphatase